MGDYSIHDPDTNQLIDVNVIFTYIPGAETLEDPLMLKINKENYGIFSNEAV